MQGEAHEAGLIGGATFDGLLGWHRRVAGPCSRKLSGAVLALLLTMAPALAGDAYLIDGSRSEAKFAIRYLLSTMVGRLRDIGGTIDLDSVNPSASSVKFSMQTASVDTGSAELDQTLRSAVFLDAAKFPQITFESAVIETTAKTNVYRVIGELTLHGVTKGVVLSVEFRRRRPRPRRTCARRLHGENDAESQGLWHQLEQGSRSRRSSRWRRHRDYGQSRGIAASANGEVEIEIRATTPGEESASRQGGAGPGQDGPAPRS